MRTEIIPLGTSAALPTKDKHFSSVALWRAGRLLLFDCGEGTQLQLRRAGLKAPQLEAIFITHLHGDHIFGLMGLLSTLGMMQYEHPLTIVGPRGLGVMIDTWPGLARDGLGFDLAYVELAEGFGKATVWDTPAYYVEARPLKHSIFAIGYRFQEKPVPGNLDVEKARKRGVTDFRYYRALKAGEVVQLADGRTVHPEEVVGPERPGVAFAYVTDTRPCEGGRLLARNADLLLHEATFTMSHQQRAIETGHATAQEAAEVARDAGARKLLISHFSARYKHPAILVEEARTIFQNTEAAEELKRYVL